MLPFFLSGRYHDGWYLKTPNPTEGEKKKKDLQGRGKKIESLLLSYNSALTRCRYSTPRTGRRTTRSIINQREQTTQLSTNTIKLQNPKQQTNLLRNQHQYLLIMPTRSVATGQDWGDVNVGRSTTARKKPTTNAAISSLKRAGLIATEQKWVTICRISLNSCSLSNGGNNRVWYYGKVLVWVVDSEGILFWKIKISKYCV